MRRHFQLWLRGATCAAAVLLSLIPAVLAAQGSAAPRNSPRLLIRSDDMGFSHASNLANQRLLESGLVSNVSVLFCAPWYKEAVDILQRHPEASIGIHLCANSEWKNYKWGPVAARDRVPSLVDADGHFWGSYRDLNVERTPDIAELETEFRAQIERALRSGLTITYLDNHMGAGMHTPEQRAMVERLANEYKLGLSGALREIRPGSFSGGDAEEQRARLASMVTRMKPDSLYLMVFHVGMDTPELRAMQDLNQDGVRNMSQQRQIELDMLLSPEFRKTLAARGVRLVSYRELLAEGRTADARRSEAGTRRRR